MAEKHTITGSEVIDRYSDLFGQYIEKSDNIIIVLFNDNFVVEEYNHGFLNLVTFRGFSGIIRGQDIRSFLIPESRDALNFSDQQVTSIKIRLHFSVSASQSMRISCSVFRVKESYLMIGDRQTLTESHFLDKMSLLNSEMVNVARELQQKNRELNQRNREIEQKNLEIEAAYSRIRILSGIIPICMHCKKIRDDEGYWNMVEKYIAKYSEAEFSHGICPQCMQKYYAEYCDTGEESI